MARSLARARQELYDATKQSLRERFAVTTEEFASIAAGLGADLDVSFMRGLEAEEPQT